MIGSIIGALVTLPFRNPDPSPDAKLLDPKIVETATLKAIDKIDGHLDKMEAKAAAKAEARKTQPGFLEQLAIDYLEHRRASNSPDE